MTRTSAGLLATAVFAAACTTACGQQPPPPGQDAAALKRQAQAMTEDIYRIHLKLDDAARSIAEAEAAARDGNASGAQYHAQEAYRAVELADEAVLELGRDLQQAAGLDQRR